MSRVQARAELLRREGTLIRGRHDALLLALARPSWLWKWARWCFWRATLLPGDRLRDSRRDVYYEVVSVRGDKLRVHAASAMFLMGYCGRSKACAWRLLETAPITEIPLRGPYASA